MKSLRLTVILLIALSLFLSGCSSPDKKKGNETPPVNPASKPSESPEPSVAPPKGDTSRFITTEDIAEAEKLREEARGLLKEGNKEEAVKTFKDALKLNPNDMEIYGELARMSEAEGDYTKAVEIYDEALKLDPNERKLRNSRAEALIILKDYGKAAETYQKIIEADRENLKAYFSLADCYLKMNQFDEAEKVYEKAVENFEASPEPLERLARLKMDRAKKETNNKKAASLFLKASGLFERAERKSSKDKKSKMSFKFAECYFLRWERTKDKNDKRDAERYLEGFIEDYPKDPLVGTAGELLARLKK